MRLAALSLSALLASFATVQSKKNDDARHRATRHFLALHAGPFRLLHAVVKPARLLDWFIQPRVLTFAALVLCLAFGNVAGATAAPLVAGVFKSKRSFPITPLPVDGGTSDYKITRGLVEAGVVISVLYSVNVTTTGAAVRARSLPVKRISLIGDNGKTLQSWQARDLIEIARIFEQTPIGALLTPASGFAVANYTLLQAHIPLMFEQARAPMGDKMALPTYAYQDLTLRIEWGTVTDLLTGTPVGPITFTAGGAVVTQIDYADLAIPGDGKALARAMPISIGRYLELTQGAVANALAEIDLGTSADIRGILISSELTTTGEPTDTIINKVSLREDNTQSVFEAVPWASLRSDNSKHFGLTMPTGIAVIDFAEDGLVGFADIYRATSKNKVKLVFDTAAVAGTIRAALLTIEPPMRV